jgi:hypothetical protein
MNITVIVIAATVAALLIYDAIVAFLKGKAQTISMVISRYSQLYPAIPFAFGFLMGHFFAQDEYIQCKRN